MAKKRTRSRRGLRGLGEPTKKDFQAMASILCQHRASSGLIGDIAGYFARQNSRFDAGRFVAATKTCRR